MCREAILCSVAIGIMDRHGAAALGRAGVRCRSGPKSKSLMTARAAGERSAKLPSITRGGQIPDRPKNVRITILYMIHEIREYAKQNAMLILQDENNVLLHFQPYTSARTSMLSRPRAPSGVLESANAV